MAALSPQTKLEDLPNDVLVLFLEKLKDPKQLLEACRTNQRILQICKGVSKLKKLVEIGFRRERYEVMYRDEIQALVQGMAFQDDPNVLSVYAQAVNRPHVATLNGFIDYYINSGNWAEIDATIDSLQAQAEDGQLGPDRKANILISNALGGLSSILDNLAPVWVSNPHATTMVIMAKDPQHPPDLFSGATSAQFDPLYSTFPKDPEKLVPPYSKGYLNIPLTPIFLPSFNWNYADFTYSFAETHNRQPTKEETQPFWDSLHKFEAYYGITPGYQPY